MARNQVGLRIALGALLMSLVSQSFGQGPTLPAEAPATAGGVQFPPRAFAWCFTSPGRFGPGRSRGDSRRAARPVGPARPVGDHRPGAAAGRGPRAGGDHGTAEPAAGRDPPVRPARDSGRARGRGSARRPDARPGDRTAGAREPRPPRPVARAPPGRGRHPDRRASAPTRSSTPTASSSPTGTTRPQRPGGPLQYDVNITYPLDVTHKRQARTLVARRAKRVLEAQYQDAVRLQIDNLYTAYSDVLGARETIRFAEAARAGARRSSSIGRGGCTSKGRGPSPT